MEARACNARYRQSGTIDEWHECQLPDAHQGGHAVPIEVHTLAVFNAVDVPADVLDKVWALLEPYDPDAYTRACDATGRVLGGAGIRSRIG